MYGDMKTLDELHAADIPRATSANVGITHSGKEAERLRRVVDAYLADFIAPPKKGEIMCVRCGRPQSGTLGFFRLSIYHDDRGTPRRDGKGYCDHCNYPARADHNMRKTEGGQEPLFEVKGFILQYHPSTLKLETNYVDAEGRVVAGLCGGREAGSGGSR